MKYILLFILLNLNFIIFAQDVEPGPGPYYFVSAKISDTIPQFYGNTIVDRNTENLSILALLLGDDPRSLLQPGQNLVPTKRFYYAERYGRYQPFAFTSCAGCEEKNLPIGPKLRNFLDNYFGDGSRLDLCLPFYTDSTRLGTNGGAWIRRGDEEVGHGAIDFMQEGKIRFDVCAAADGVVDSRKGDIIRLRHLKKGKEFITAYHHLDSNSYAHLSVGTPLKMGQKIGNLKIWPGNEHLHFMVFLKAPTGTIDGITISDAFFAIDPFGVYDYRRNSTNLSTYNYLPDISSVSKPDAYLYQNVRGSVNTVQWQTNPLVYSYPEIYGPMEKWTDNPFFGDKGTFFTDATGDGKADAIVVNQNLKVTLRRSTGSKFSANEEWTDIPFFGDRGTFFADVTGDGKADAIAVNQSMKVTVRRSTGSKFSANEEWTDIPFYGDKGTYFADVTGDGKADAIAVNQNLKVTVRRSTGSGFSANEEWTDIPFFGDKGTFFADVTGDGRADAISVRSNGPVLVRRSNGMRFLPDENWTQGSWYGANGSYMADVDGDGKQDMLILIGLDNRLLVRFSDGVKFLPEERAVSNSFSGEKGVFFADLTGNNSAEAIIVKNSQIQARKFRTRFR